MGEKVLVAGVGLVPFAAPGTGASYEEMAFQAMAKALREAQLGFGRIQQVYVGHAYGRSGLGQRACARLGMTGSPIFTIGNNGLSGSTAFYLARQAVESGATESALVLGFDEILPAEVPLPPDGRLDPLAQWKTIAGELQPGPGDLDTRHHLHGGAAAEFLKQYSLGRGILAKLVEKSRRHAENNPNALLRAPLTTEQVLDQPVVFGPLTAPQIAPPASGAAAIILCSPGFAMKNALLAMVSVPHQAMRSDLPSTLTKRSLIKAAGYDLIQSAASMVYSKAGIGPDALKFVEIADLSTVAELSACEAIGLVSAQDFEKFVAEGQNTHGGRVVVNPSGGQLALGHAPGASGLAQSIEVIDQLRSNAGRRQVRGVGRWGMQVDCDIAGGAIVTLFQSE
jgi:acetyl-CoA acyltransferase